MVALDAFVQPGSMLLKQRLARCQGGIAALAQFGVADDVVQRLPVSFRRRMKPIHSRSRGP